MNEVEKELRNIARNTMFIGLTGLTMLDDPDAWTYIPYELYGVWNQLSVEAKLAAIITSQELERRFIDY